MSGMLKLRIIFAAAAILSAASLAFGQESAKAELKPTQGNKAQGTINFKVTPDGLLVSGNLTGVPPGNHGFHIHEKGDCSAPDGTSAGGHFNPTGKKHGGPTSPEHHVGDMGNVFADADGNVNVDDMLTGVELSGPNSIIGKAVILHAGEDDFTTQPTGNAGARIACGVIQ